MSPAISDQLQAKIADFIAEQPPGDTEQVHMSSFIAEHVILNYSKPGHKILDPFAGYGTTLKKAVKHDRQAVGVELLPERIEHILQYIPKAEIVEGDARELLKLISENSSTSSSSRDHNAAIGNETGSGDSALFDLVLTAPPYMTINDHEADPLTAYEKNTGNYRRYLRELEIVAAQCKRLMRSGAYIVWNAADIKHKGVLTPLIADFSEMLAKHFQPISTTKIVWDQLPHDLVNDALIVFQKE